MKPIERHCAEFDNTADALVGEGSLKKRTAPTLRYRGKENVEQTYPIPWRSIRGPAK
jgi:hypothetical protein